MQAVSFTRLHCLPRVALAGILFMGAARAPARDAMSPDDTGARESLARLLDKTDPRAAAIARDPAARRENYPAPFLKSGGLHRLIKFTPARPLILYIGTGGDAAAVLNGDPGAFARFARSAGLMLDDPGLRAACVKAFLEVSEAGKGRFLILNSADDLRERPRLSPEEVRRYREIRAMYAPVIAPPSAPENDPRRIVLFAVPGQALVKITAAIRPDATLETARQTLESNLPIPYAW